MSEKDQVLEPLIPVVSVADSSSPSPPLTDAPTPNQDTPLPSQKPHKHSVSHSTHHNHASPSSSPSLAPTPTVGFVPAVNIGAHITLKPNSVELPDEDGVGRIVSLSVGWDTYLSRERPQEGGILQSILMFLLGLVAFTGAVFTWTGIWSLLDSWLMERSIWRDLAVYCPIGFFLMVMTNTFLWNTGVELDDWFLSRNDHRPFFPKPIYSYGCCRSELPCVRLLWLGVVALIAMVGSGLAWVGIYSLLDVHIHSESLWWNIGCVLGGAFALIVTRGLVGAPSTRVPGYFNRLRVRRRGNAVSSPYPPNRMRLSNMSKATAGGGARSAFGTLRNTHPDSRPLYQPPIDYGRPTHTLHITQQPRKDDTSHHHPHYNHTQISLTHESSSINSPPFVSKQISQQSQQSTTATTHKPFAVSISEQVSGVSDIEEDSDFRPGSMSEMPTRVSETKEPSSRYSVEQSTAPISEWAYIFLYIRALIAFAATTAMWKGWVMLMDYYFFDPSVYRELGYIAAGTLILIISSNGVLYGGLGLDAPPVHEEWASTASLATQCLIFLDKVFTHDQIAAYLRSLLCFVGVVFLWNGEDNLVAMYLPPTEPYHYVAYFFEGVVLLILTKAFFGTTGVPHPDDIEDWDDGPY